MLNVYLVMMIVYITGCEVKDFIILFQIFVATNVCR